MRSPRPATGSISRAGRCSPSRSAFLVGTAGAAYGHVLGFIAPNNFTFGDSLILVSIVLSGGIGNPWGVAVAAAFVVILPEKFQVIQEYRFVLYAALVILDFAVPSGRTAAAPPARLYSRGARRRGRHERRAARLPGVDLPLRRAGRARRRRFRRERRPDRRPHSGPNGSGKTTFFNVVTGIYRADEGTVSFAGADMTAASAQAVYRVALPAPSSVRACACRSRCSTTSWSEITSG